MDFAAEMLGRQPVAEFMDDLDEQERRPEIQQIQPAQQRLTLMQLIDIVK